MNEKVPLGPPKEETGLPVVTEKKDKLPLPGWSEKMGQGILTGVFVSPNKSFINVTTQSVAQEVYLVNCVYKEWPLEGTVLQRSSAFSAGPKCNVL